MAKIEAIAAKVNKSKKRKLKEDSGDARSVEAESPSSKFKKLDISQIRAKKAERSSQTKAVVMMKSPIKTPTKKRKSATATTSETKSKKLKSSSGFNVDHIGSSQDASDTPDDEDDAADGGGDDSDAAEPHEPTLKELSQALQPENTPDIETTRQKKKAKHQKNIEIAKIDSAQRELQRNADYLNNWKTNRTEWKFEKLRQISIQNNLFKDMDDDSWQLAVEYLAGTKGAGREVIIKKAEEIINDIDGRINEHNKMDMVNLKSYNRARELLQSLQ